MEDVLDAFLVYLKREYKYSNNTVAAYRNDLQQFHEYLTEEHQPPIDDWADVSPAIIENYLLSLQNRPKPYAASSVARKVAAVKSFYNFLFARDMVIENPATGIDSPKVKKRLPHTLAEEEIEHLLLAPAQGNTPKHLRDTALLNMLYATGMRVTEVVTLHTEDVDLDDGVLHIVDRDGGNRMRTMDLDDELQEILDRYLADGRPYLIKGSQEPALFLNHRGQQLTRQGLWLIIKAYAREAQLNEEVTPHTLRHSFAAHKLNSGTDLEEVQKLLGHANISTTQIYRQLDDESEPLSD